MVNISKRNSCFFFFDKIKQNIGDLFKIRWVSSDIYVICGVLEW